MYKMGIVSGRVEIVPHPSERHHEGIQISHKCVKIERKRSSYDQDRARREGEIRIMESQQRGSGVGTNRKKIPG